MSEEKTLDEIRQRIDAIDLEIQNLLSERGRAAQSVAEIKLRDAGGKPVDFYRPEREAQILNEVAHRNEGPFDDRSVQRVFREIISASLALEKPLQVAYLGPEGTYSHAATLKHFGHSVQPMPEPGIGEIFQSVEAGRVAFGVVPVENSTEGAINHTLDLLMETPLRICGEVRLRIQHLLLSESASLEDITVVRGHPQSLAQCRGWLDTHLSHAKRENESSNAKAAQMVVGKPGEAAIAGDSAASKYNLNALVSGIEDIKNNTTRFYIVGDRDVPASGRDSTSLMVGAPHKPGGLRRMLLPLEEAGVSMTRIESRPGRTKLWDYVFFIDVDGHQNDAVLAKVLETMANEAPMVRVLGSYPSAL